MKKELNLKNLKQEFNLNVDGSAQYQPNAEEFYSRAFLAWNVEDFNVQLGVKTSTKIGRIKFGDGGSILKEFNCGFSPETVNMDAETLNVVSITVPHQICKSDLENSFAQLEMTQGRDGWKTADRFWAHYMNELANEISEDLSIAKWQSQSGPDLAQIFGFEDAILAAEGLGPNNTQRVAFNDTSFTVANIESAFESLAASLPSSISRKKDDLRFYVSPDVATKIAIAQSKGNSTFYTTKELDLMFANIKISVQDGMSGEMIVLTRKENMVIGLDAELDKDNIQIADLSIIAESSIRTRVDFTFGTLTLNKNEIYFLTLA